MSWQDWIYDFFTYVILAYSVVLLLCYLFIAFYSIGETRKYIRKSSFTDYSIMAVSPHTPSISILAPAYNEAATVIENVKSLLNIHYNNMEVIVINDGSKDDSLQKLIEAYQLEITPYLFTTHISTKPVRGIYRSSNPVYRKLVVVDKQNGGKADALNVGINLGTAAGGSIALTTGLVHRHVPLYQHTW